jgi:hypothetical protein
MVEKMYASKDPKGFTRWTGAASGSQGGKKSTNSTVAMLSCFCVCAFFLFSVRFLAAIPTRRAPYFLLRRKADFKQIASQSKINEISEPSFFGATLLLVIRVHFSLVEM